MKLKTQTVIPFCLYIYEGMLAPLPSFFHLPHSFYKGKKSKNLTNKAGIWRRPGHGPLFWARQRGSSSSSSDRGRAPQWPGSTKTGMRGRSGHTGLLPPLVEAELQDDAGLLHGRAWLGLLVVLYNNYHPTRQLVVTVK
jgi:hypothetical protein